MFNSKEKRFVIYGAMDSIGNPRGTTWVCALIDAEPGAPSFLGKNMV